MVGKLMEADEASDGDTENPYSSAYIKLSNMWGKRRDVYVERPSATNAHKSEDFELPINS